MTDTTTDTPAKSGRGRHPKPKKVATTMDNRPLKEMKHLPQQLYTTDQAAEKLFISKRTLQRRMGEGLISPIVMGPRKHMFSEEEILRFINNHIRRPSAE